MNNEAVIKTRWQIEPCRTINEVFNRCFLNHFEGLYTYAFFLLKDNEDAEDVCQLAFIKLWEKRKSVDLLQAGRAYLYTTVYHIALNRIRDKKNRQKIDQYNHSTKKGEYINTTEIKDLKKRISGIIESLPSRCKEVFIKSRIEGKKYNEIATEMGTSVKTVEVQMGKALRTLRDGLSDYKEFWLIIFFYTNLISI